MTEDRVHVGIDVSKARLDVALGDEIFAVANDAAGLAALQERLQRHAIAAIGIEASGGYERRAVRTLRAAGLPVRRIDSWRLRQFAKAMGERAKTDALDAAMIARFVASLPPQDAPAPDPAYEVLQHLVAYRRGLVAERVALDNQLQQLADAELCALTKARRDLAARTILLVERRLRTLIRAHADLRRKATLLQSAPGVGFLTAVTLLADLPELGRLGPKQIAALAGLAPYARQSGTTTWRARCQGGRAQPRAALFLAVLTQLRRCAWARAALDRLVRRGKPKMVGIVALMRKLLLALNAMLKQDRPWQHPTQTA